MAARHEGECYKNKFLNVFLVCEALSTNDVGVAMSTVFREIRPLVSKPAISLKKIWECYHRTTPGRVAFASMAPSTRLTTLLPGLSPGDASDPSSCSSTGNKTARSPEAQDLSFLVLVNLESSHSAGSETTAVRTLGQSSSLCLKITACIT